MTSPKTYKFASFVIEAIRQDNGVLFEKLFKLPKFEILCDIPIRRIIDLIIVKSSHSCLEIMLKRHIDLFTETNDESLTTLQLACTLGDLDSSEMIFQQLEKKLSYSELYKFLHKSTPEGFTAAHLAHGSGNPVITSWIMSKGASLSNRTRTGCTPTMIGLPLPKGWKTARVKSGEDIGRIYFYNRETKETRWDYPTSSSTKVASSSTQTTSSTLQVEEEEEEVQTKSQTQSTSSSTQLHFNSPSITAQAQVYPQTKTPVQQKHISLDNTAGWSKISKDFYKFMTSTTKMSNNKKLLPRLSAGDISSDPHPIYPDRSILEGFLDEITAEYQPGKFPNRLLECFRSLFGTQTHIFKRKRGNLKQNWHLSCFFKCLLHLPVGSLLCLINTSGRKDYLLNQSSPAGNGFHFLVQNQYLVNFCPKELKSRKSKGSKKPVMEYNFIQSLKKAYSLAYDTNGLPAVAIPFYYQLAIPFNSIFEHVLFPKWTPGKYYTFKYKDGTNLKETLSHAMARFDSQQESSIRNSVFNAINLYKRIKDKSKPNLILDSNGHTPLSLASLSGNRFTFIAILMSERENKSSSLSILNPQGQNWFQLAVWNNHIEFVHYILYLSGANVSTTHYHQYLISGKKSKYLPRSAILAAASNLDNQGKSVIHYAVYHQNVAMLDILYNFVGRDKFFENDRNNITPLGELSAVCPGYNTHSHPVCQWYKTQFPQYY